MLGVHSSNSKCRTTVFECGSTTVPRGVRIYQPDIVHNRVHGATQENKANRIDPLYAVPAKTSAVESPSTGKGRAKENNPLDKSSSGDKCPFDHAKPHGTGDSPSTALPLRKPRTVAVFGWRAKAPDLSVVRDGRDLNMVATPRTPRTLFPIYLVCLLR